jgi:hypothetical protein
MFHDLLKKGIVIDYNILQIVIKDRKGIKQDSLIFIIFSIIFYKYPFLCTLNKKFPMFLIGLKVS